MISFRVDLSAINAQLDSAKAGSQASLRPAAQAGAQVIYDEVKRNVAKLGKKTGNLTRSIYQAYSKDNSTYLIHEYHVSWNARKAPHGHLVEFGHRQRYATFVDSRTGKWVTDKSKPLASPRTVAAQPFIRPAYAAIPMAQQAMIDAYINVMTEKGHLT